MICENNKGELRTYKRKNKRINYIKTRKQNEQSECNEKRMEIIM